MFPCQDTPSAKFTFDAEVTIDDPNLKAFVSGIYKGQVIRDGKTYFQFDQKVPISSYLFAIVCGNL
jgi:leukotriene-A4 hydrolase